MDHTTVNVKSGIAKILKQYRWKNLDLGSKKEKYFNKTQNAQMYKRKKMIDLIKI